MLERWLTNKSGKLMQMKTKLQQIILGLTIFGALFSESTVCGAALGNSAQELNTSIQAQPSATKLPPIAYLQVLASVGPLEYLSGAQVFVRDSGGKLISKGYTNTRGSIIFYLSQAKLASVKMPLRITTRGGEIIGQTGDQLSGPPFLGHLYGRVNKVKLRTHTSSYLDLISTSASVMQSKSYASATKAVRDALGIGNRFPINGIRFINNHVGWTELQTAIMEHGGYDSFVKQMVRRIQRREKITELSPSRSASSGQGAHSSKAEVVTTELPGSSQAMAITAQADTTTSTQPTFPVCSAPVPTGTNGSSMSEEIIMDVGAAAMKGLLTVAGVPSSAAGGLAGMLLTGGAQGNPSTDQLNAVEAQLVCISAQINYLSSQVEATYLAETLQDANTCKGYIATQFQNYQNLVANSLPYGTNTVGIQSGSACYGGSSVVEGTPSSCPLNSSNLALMQDLTQWDPNPNLNGTYSDLAFSCSNGGGIINSAIFIPPSSGESAWQQVNNNTQQQNNWYTATQVQYLQGFLANWSTAIYNYFIVVNEYYNYYGINSSNQAFSNNLGNVPGSSVCLDNTATTSNSFCAAASNFTNAYPPDLYSDEIGIWDTSGAGLAIGAYPAGLAFGGSQLSLNPYYLGTIIPNGGSWSAANVTAPSLSQFNSYGINPSGQPSAVQQFSNPQALKTLQPISSQISSLQYPQATDGTTSANGDNWADAWNFFVNSINSIVGDTSVGTPPFPIPSQWTNLVATTSQPPNGTGFFTVDNVATLSSYQNGNEYCDTYTQSQTVSTLDFNNTIGDYYWQDTACGNTTPNNTDNMAPVFGVLLARNWWPAVNSSSTYIPPDPITQNEVASAPTNVSAAQASPGYIALDFTNPSSSGSGGSISSYLGTCTNASSTFTGSASSSPVQIGPFPQSDSGMSFSCSVQGVNPTGAGIPSTGISATPTPGTAPAQPVITSVVYQGIGYAYNFNFNPSSSESTTPATSYSLSCVSSYYGYSETVYGFAPVATGPIGINLGPTYYSCSVIASNSYGTSISPPFSYAP
jgi:hypothetical protein